MNSNHRLEKILVSKIFICFINFLILITLLMIYKNLTSIDIIISIFLGLIYAHAAELLHEVLHLKKSKITRFFGFLLGLPMFISYSDYRNSHLKHHRTVGTKEDEEFFRYSSFKTWTQFLIALSMLSHIKITFTKLFIMNFDVQKNAKFEYQLMILILSVLMSCSLSLGCFKVFLFGWILPYFFITNPIHFLIELPEHLGCAKDDKNILKNTRTIKSNIFISWFVNGNNWHAEHHLKPWLPISDLRQVHLAINKDIENYEEGYTKFYYKLLRDIFSASNKK